MGTALEEECEGNLWVKDGIFHCLVHDEQPEDMAHDIVNQRITRCRCVLY